MIKEPPLADSWTWSPGGELVSYYCEVDRVYLEDASEKHEKIFVSLWII